MSPNSLASVDAFAYRVPIKMPTKVVLSALCDRPMVPDRLLEGLVLQPGEAGLTGQAPAGVDMALRDPNARRSDPPMYRHLVAPPLQPMPVYAADINPDEFDHFAVARFTEGRRAFKLNTGSRHDFDVSNLTADLAALQPYQTGPQA